MKKFTLSIALLGLISFEAISQDLSREKRVINPKGVNPDTEKSISVPVNRNGLNSVAATYSDDFSGANDTLGLAARGYLTYFRGVGGPGTTPHWYQGDAVGIWPAYNGAGDSYVVSDYNSVTGANNIDNWLVLPALNVSAGDVISFWSRSVASSTFPDSIKVMYSAAGDSIPEALTWVELGNFVVNITGNWLQNSFSAPTAGSIGRFAIRYAVVDGGPAGANSNVIGIDQLEVNTPPASDAGVTAVTNIPSGCGLSATTPISITVNNYGGSAITGFSVSYTVNGGTPVTETFTGSIASLSSANYTFTTTANLSVVNTYTINAYTTLSGDANASNDAFSISTTNSAATAITTGTPFAEGFESAVTPTPPTGWTVEDTDGDLNKWDFPATFTHSGSVCARIGFGNPVAAVTENWLFTPCLDLLAGTNYVVEFFYKTFDGLATAYQLETRLGTSNTSGSMTNSIATEPVPSDSAYYFASHGFTVPSNGTYYLGFNGFGAGVTSSTRVDDIAISVSTGVKDLTNSANLLVGPNPTNGLLTIASKITEEATQLVITNYLGQPVYSQKYTTAFKTQVDLSTYASGIYAVQLITSKGAITKTITLQSK